MNNLPFPPIVLTHITKDNALSHGACETGIKQVIDAHQLSDLTAISVSILLKSKKLTQDQIYWIKSIAGIDENENEYGYVDEVDENENGYGYGEGYGKGIANGYGYGEGYGEGYEDGYGDENDNDN